MQNAMKLRGGMSNLGPLNPGNFNGAMQVAAAVTAAAAVTEKYGGIGETALTKKFKGDVWNTNLIIQLTTGVASTVVYSVGVANPFEAAKITSVLWLIGVLSKLKDAEFDVKTLGSKQKYIRTQGDSKGHAVRTRAPPLARASGPAGAAHREVK